MDKLMILLSGIMHRQRGWGGMGWGGMGWDGVGWGGMGWDGMEACCRLAITSVCAGKDTKY